MKNQMSIAATILAVAGIGARGPKFVIPAKQAVSKRHPSEAQTPEIVILYVESSSQIGQFEGEACGASRSS